MEVRYCCNVTMIPISTGLTGEAASIRHSIANVQFDVLARVVSTVSH